MYTSYIGKIFLKLYNEKEQKNLSAKQFFDEILFPLFFDGEKHLMHVHGSSFFQKIRKSDLASGNSESIIRLNRLHKDIENMKISGSTYVGYAAEKIEEVTSGQVSSLDCKIDADEIYASWIGEGLAIGLSGGLILLSQGNILWALFKGWQFYRNYINQTPNLKGRQIETWNGHWLCHYFSSKFKGTEPLNGFELPTTQDDEEKGVVSIPTKDWVKVIFALTKIYPKQIITCYAYFLGKTNTTLGFINIYLPEVRRLYEFRDKVFIDKEQTIMNDKEIEQLETFYKFKNVCKLGTLGLKSIEPKGFRIYMPIGTYQYAQGKKIDFTKENSLYIFPIIKLWVIAMLNKTELLELASEVAASILNIENEQKPESRGKTTASREATKILDSRSVKTFIDNLTESIELKPHNARIFKQVVKEILIMPIDNFPLFVTLIKFEYYYQKSL